MRISENHGQKWYADTSERCFRSAGALTVYHLDSKHVDVDKLIECLRKEKIMRENTEVMKEVERSESKKSSRKTRSSQTNKGGFNLFWFLQDWIVKKCLIYQIDKIDKTDQISQID